MMSFKSQNVYVLNFTFQVNIYESSGMNNNSLKHDTSIAAIVLYGWPQRTYNRGCTIRVVSVLCMVFITLMWESCRPHKLVHVLTESAPSISSTWLVIASSPPTH